MLNEKMGIDNIDCMIMDLIQNDPNLTHAQIANYVNRSQPTIGTRIRRLQKMGVLKYQAGISLKNENICAARVDIQTDKPKAAFNMIKNCPFMLNAFVLSGNMNISIIIVAENYRVLEQLINYHFRKNPVVSKVNMEIIVNVAEDLVLPLKFNIEHTKYCPVCNDSVKQERKKSNPQL
ncbi:MAG: Lrp/AsnC family transcriptional regulator [Promethearchaeota archaeon]|jgi:DNA-binding Lrp family transcriptional regulator